MHPFKFPCLENCRCHCNQGHQHGYELCDSAARASDAGNAPTEDGTPCKTSCYTHDEALAGDSTHKGRAAEVSSDVRPRQAPGSRQASGGQSALEDSAEPSASVRRREVSRVQQDYGTHVPAEQHREPMVEMSPDKDCCMEESVAWQPYVRRAGVQSMDLDAICMPPS